MKKNTIIALLVVGGIAGVIGYRLGKQSSVPVKRIEPTPKQQTITEDEQRPEVTTLASRHNAVVGWHRGLSDRSLDQPILTAELQRALMPEPKRPVLIVGRVKDLVNSPEPDARTVTLQWGQLFFHIVFEMMCPTAEAEKLFHGRRDWTKPVAAIVLVDGVRRKERAQRQDQEISPESLGLFLERSFHVTAKCSEMLVLGGK
jgi:hypothetical protein